MNLQHDQQSASFLFQSPQKIFSIATLQPKMSQLRIWNLEFDLPGQKVNKLNPTVMGDFAKVLDYLKLEAHRVDVLLLTSGKKGQFIAGADIEMIVQAKTKQEATELSLSGQALMNEFEDFSFVKIAAVNGPALGGGCEFALACDAIVMSQDKNTKLGLPETQLGLIPGMGGMIRLPAKVGLATALDLILSGKSLNADRAYKAGLIEAVLPTPHFIESVVSFAEREWPRLRARVRIAKEPKLGGAGGLMGRTLESQSLGRSFIMKQAQKSAFQKTKGHYPAIEKAIEVLKENDIQFNRKLKGQKRDKALKVEANAFGELAVSNVSKNLIRLFFMTEEVKKGNGLTPFRTLELANINSAAVLGAGVMGGGIAQLFADKGIAVRMKDIQLESLQAGIKAANKIFLKDLKRRKLNQREMVQKLSLISPTLDYSGFNSSEVIVEAVVENINIKKMVLQEVESKVAPHCIIASNTSSLSITEMQNTLKRPENFVGMHFFNPVHKMPLIEVIRGEKTSDAAVVSIFQLSKRLGKIPVVVKDSPGFLVNRLLMPYLNEATWMVSEGVDITELDQALLKFGMPMGPMELIDEVGIDVGEKVAHILFDAFGSRVEASSVNAKLVKEGYLGRKNKKGFYHYNDEGKKGEVNTSVYQVMGVTPKQGLLSSEEMVARCLLSMINEAARCLEEKVVETPDDIDLAMIMGTGFPPFRGGLMRYADTLGVDKIVSELDQLKQKQGTRYECAPYLLELKNKGLSFRSSDQGV